MDKKYITIFSQKLAGYLMLNGFVLIAMRKDKNGSERNIFFFNNSQEIISFIKKYKSIIL